MADGVGSGVELAPLRGKVVLDLTEFNEALEDLESSVDSITDSLSESLEIITNKMSEFRDQFKEPLNIQVALKDTKAVEQLEEVNQEVQQTADSFFDIIDQVEAYDNAVEELIGVYDQVRESEPFTQTSDEVNEANTSVMSSVDAMQQYIESLNMAITQFKDLGIEIDDISALYTQLTANQREGLSQFENDIMAISSNWDKLEGKFDELAESCTGDEESLHDLFNAMNNLSAKSDTLAESLTADQKAFQDLKTSSEQATQEFNSVTGKIDDLSESAEENAHEGEAWGEAWYEKATMVALGLQMVVEQLDEIGQKSAQLSQVSSTTLPFLDAGSPGVIKSLQNLINNSGSLGLDNNQVAGMIAQLTLALRQYGGTKSEVAGTTEEIIKMADQLDLATGGEIDFEDAVEALRAELGGQSFSLEMMGINISKTAENQAALNSQWHEAYSKLTPYEQKAIDMQVVQNSLNKTFGDTSKYLDSTAGKYLVAKANLSNAVTTLGVQLLPVLTSVFKELSQVITKIQDFTRWMQKAHPATLHVVEDLGELALKLSPAIVGVAVFGKTVSTLIKTARGIKNVTSDFKKLAKVSTEFKDMKTAIGKSMLALKKVVNGTFRGITKVIRTSAQIIKKSSSAIAKLFVNLGSKIKSALQISANLVKKFSTTVAKTLVNLGSKLKTAIGAVTNIVKTGISTFGGILKTGISTLFSSLRTVILKGISVLTDTVLPAIGEFIVAIGPVGWALIGLTATVALLYESWKHNWFGMRTIVDDVGKWLQQEGLGNIVKFVEAVAKLPEDVTHTLLRARDDIGKIFESWGKERLNRQNEINREYKENDQTLEKDIGNIWSNMWKKITTISSDNAKTQQAIAKSTSDILSSVWKNCENTAVSIWDSITQSMSSAAQRRREEQEANAKETGEALAAAWNWCENTAVSIWNATGGQFINWLGDMFNDLSDWIGSMQNAWDNWLNGWLDTLGGWISDAKSYINDFFGWATSMINDLGNIIKHPISSIEGMFLSTSIPVTHSLVAMPQPIGFMALPNPDTLIHNTTTHTVINNTSTIQETPSTNNVPTIGELHLHSPNYIDPFETYNKMEELSRLYANGIYIGN